MTETLMAARALQGDAEIDGFFQLGIRTFVRDVPDVAAAAMNWRKWAERQPSFDPSNLRGVFRDGVFIGGYIIYERRQRLGGAWLPVAGIGGVATQPEFRHQGAGRTMMLDAIEYARSRKHALLLLDGIPNFYSRFGYWDVIDNSEHFFRREEILKQEESPYAVRHWQAGDEAELYALYGRHFGSRPGGFEHTPEEYANALAARGPETGPWVAVDPQGRLRGYMYVRRPPEHWRADEVALDDWPAALALLRHHAGWFAEGDNRPELAWALPRDSVAFFAIAEHLRRFDEAPQPEASGGWTLRSESYTMGNGGWMARIADAGVLIDALLDSWHGRAAGWTGRLALELDGGSYRLEFGPEGVRRCPPGGTPDCSLKLSGQAFVQLLYGHRPVSWIAAQAGQEIPGTVVALLENLFPYQPAWIPGTEGF